MYSHVFTQYTMPCGNVHKVVQKLRWPRVELRCMLHTVMYVYMSNTHFSMCVAALHHGHHQHLEGVAQWLLLQTPQQNSVCAVLQQFDPSLSGKRCRPHAGKTTHDRQLADCQWLLQEFKSKEEHTI